MAASKLSRTSAVFRISDALPQTIDEGEWIIICDPGDMTVSSHPAAITDADEAARPSTTAVTLALWARSMLRIVIASVTSPPGLLIRKMMCDTVEGSASSTVLMSSALMLHHPNELICPYMRMVATSPSPEEAGVVTTSNTSARDFGGVRAAQ